jgi:hypothetical protein
MPTVPQYVSAISAGVDNFNPGSGLPLLDRKGVLVSVQGDLDTIVARAAALGIQLAFSGTAPSTTFVPGDNTSFLACTIDPRLLGAGVAVAMAATNNAIFERIELGERAVISKIGLIVGTASGNISVGVYSNNGSPGTNAAPATRKATSGAVACPAAGYQEIALTTAVALEDGDWLALSADNTTATFRAMAATQALAAAKGLSGLQATAHPLPATAVATFGSVNSVFLSGVI